MNLTSIYSKDDQRSAQEILCESGDVRNTGSITFLLSQRRLTEVDNVWLRRYSVRETRVIPRVMVFARHL